MSLFQQSPISPFFMTTEKLPISPQIKRELHIAPNSLRPTSIATSSHYGPSDLRPQARILATAHTRTHAPSMAAAQLHHLWAALFAAATMAAARCL